MTESYACADAHAYVDNSLSQTDRASFEAAMRRDSKLKSRVEAWQAQNEAIRLAFGAAPKSRLPSSFGRPSNENNPPSKSGAARTESSTPKNAAHAVASVAPRRRSRRAAIASGLAVLAAVLLGFCGGPRDLREPLMRRAEAALRATGPSADSRLDFASDDPRAVATWLGPRFARVTPDRLSTPGLTLLGVRVVPGLDSAAALVLFEDARGSRAGLLIEPTDALPELPPEGKDLGNEIVVAGAESNFAYAAVGPVRSGVAGLAPARR